ncbi:C4-dicarboxylate TRAP transporter substrate-binding protein [Sphaerochaeta globosa]|uniref:Extracellular solute-binding protein, family 7 n=1 Tax=Sphaerochaeta globosa (strain ATCC BAA-1886 / DSM 22777 / Buddy) TaxID=158189 RepID=F0RUF8_SPHGB|nr:C4-dicarboxylate TRAP transporter substrate-binding protein [Sphaerochaeta globosa]ADY12320.1 Extracellular solute-binding protein, family 7 [Sphaerochaeta globosa str. Buddy]
MRNKHVAVVAIVLMLAMVTVSVFAQGGAEKGDKVYTLKLSTQLNETTPMVEGFKALAESVKARSNGRLVVEVYPSAQLGSDEDVIEQALQGVNVAVLTDGGRMGNYVKDIAIIGMAYFANNYDDVLKVTQSAKFAEWEKELVDKNGIRILSFNWYDGGRHFFTNKVVNTPSDLKGLRIRTPGAPAWAESVTALGATPVAMPWGETYSAVQSKAVDGCEVQLTSALGSRIYEVLKYMVRTEHFQLINGLIVGEKWFQTLPADLQTILLEETKAAGEKNARYVESKIADIEKQLVGYGITVIEPDVQAFVKASDAAYAKLGFADLRKEIYKQIGK